MNKKYSTDEQRLIDELRWNNLCEEAGKINPDKGWSDAMVNAVALGATRDLRDQMAMAAMQILMSTREKYLGSDAEVATRIAERSYQMADAMLAVRG